MFSKFTPPAEKIQIEQNKENRSKITVSFVEGENQNFCSKGCCEKYFILYFSYK